MIGSTPRFLRSSRRRNKARVQVYDYEEEFTRVRRGEIRSQSDRSFSFEGSRGKVYEFSLEQTITFDEGTSCSLEATDPSKRSTKLISARNYITYDSQEQVSTSISFLFCCAYIAFDLQIVQIF